MVGFSRFIRSCYTSYRFKVWKCAGISQSPIPAKLNTGTGKKISKYLGILAVSGFCFGMILTPPIACSDRLAKSKQDTDKTEPSAKREKTEIDEGCYSESVKWELKDPEGLTKRFADTYTKERKAVLELLDLFHLEGPGYLRGKEITIKHNKKFRLDYQKSYEKDNDFAIFHIQKNIREFPSTVAATHVEIPGGKEVIEKKFVIDALKLSFDRKKICLLYVRTRK